MLYQLTRLKEILEGEGEIPALRFAAKINCLGKYRDIIQRGWSARSNPDFYRQLGLDPEESQARALTAIRSLLSESAS